MAAGAARPHVYASPPQFACPMDCEHGTLYDEAFKKCPRCDMTLLQVRDGQMEHTDHNPKHGGTFFMADDGWHHIEGVVDTAREQFVLHIYDNFTKPIEARYTGTLEAAHLYCDGTFSAGSTIVNLRQDSTTLVGTLPADTAARHLRVRIKFKPDAAASLFEFTVPPTQFNPDTTWVPSE